MRFLVSFFATAVLLISIVAGMNFIVDVGHTFHIGSDQAYANEYAERLRKSAYGLVYNEIERPMKLALARTSQADCYVTGSSHEWTINLARAPVFRTQCSVLMNLGVSASSYSDAITFLAALGQRGGVRVFVGIDPWFFHYHRDDERSFQDQDEVYQEARRSLGLNPAALSRWPSVRKYTNLLNGEYFLENSKHLIKTWTRTLPAIVEAREGNADDAWRPDGSFVYKDSAQFKVEEFPKCWDTRVNPPFVEEPVVDEFRHVVEVLNKRGVSVGLILMPYHPGVFRCSGYTVAALREIEQAVRDLAASQSIPVYGSYQPTAFGLKFRDFLDDQHVSPENVARVLK